ncbi:MAG: right-handed parallel beta-helix repeat-containing protein, partial [Phycisphaerales bacterium]
VTGSGVHETGLLDGFTIVGGFAIGNMSLFGDNGGGIFVKGGSPMLKNCKFTDCMGFLGGAMYAEESEAALIECTFTDNHAFNGGAVYCLRGDLELISCVFSDNLQTRAYWGIDIFWYEGAGGLYCADSSPSLTDCVFSRNVAEQGGGLFIHESNPTLIRCSFTSNMARGIPVSYGGGMLSIASSPTLANCSFTGNVADPRASGGGGAIQNFGSDAILKNCTFAGNSAQYGNATSCSSWHTWLEVEKPSKVELTNCIVWDSDRGISQAEGSSINITFSNVQKGWGGEGNIDVDPLFVGPGYWADAVDPNIVVEPNDPNAIWIDGYYHLKSAVGRWDPVNGSWVKDDVTSPCIDAGDPNSDYGQEIWPHGGRINMGAHGGTPQASLSAEPQAMSLPRVAYIHHSKVDVAQGYQALLITHGCPTALVPWHEAATTAFDAFDLIIAGTDTGYLTTWADEQNVAAVESPGKPVVGLGNGGYWYFGQLGLAIGRPNGARGSGNEIEPVDPNHPLFNEPYPVGIPEDGRIEVSSETDSVIIFLYPVPVTVTALGQDAGNAGYYSLVLEHDRYLFSGFDVSAESLTEAGRALFVNVVIRTANAAWPTDANYTLHDSRFPRAKP